MHKLSVVDAFLAFRCSTRANVLCRYQLLGDRCRDHCGAIAEHLGEAPHYLGGVVTYTDNGIRVQGLRVLSHEAKGFGSGLLTKLGIDGDISTKNGLNAAEKVPDN